MKNMKTLRTLCLLAIALAIVTVTKAESFLDRVSVSPFAALKTAEITGGSTLGAGLDAGVSVNPFVSIHATALALETCDWRDSVIDQSEFYVRANLVKFANETFVTYVKAGATRDWGGDDWALGAGLGAELKLSKNVGIGADYTLNAWFGNEVKSSLARGFLTFHF